MTTGREREATTRLMGASIARMPGSVVEQLLGMRERIRRFNEQRGLRTALLYAGGWFVQWHEGPAEAVEETWRISRSHAGHKSPRLIHRSIGPASLAAPLQIATLHGQERPTDVARRLHGIDAENAAGEGPEPLGIWRRLSAPRAGRYAHESPAERWQVLAVTSESTGCVDLVKALAEHCRVPVSYQRFAGGDCRNGDAGAAFVDVGWPVRTRVHALSHHALANDIVKLSLQHLDGVVLLQPGRTRRSGRSWDAAVTAFAQGMVPPPPLHLVGPERNPLEAVLALIEAPLAAHPVRREG
jgi:hypothetical protein